MKKNNIKKHVKEIYGCVLLIVFTLTLIYTLGYWFRPTEIDYCLTNIDTYHKQEKNSIDLIVHGSSHAWYGIDTSILEQDYGIKSYNISCNGEHVNTTNLMVKDSLKSQTPKVMIIDTFRFSEYVHSNAFDYEIYYTRRLPLDGNKLRYIHKWFGGFYGEYIHYFFPLVAYHDKWESIKFSDFQMNDKGVDLDKTRGYFFTENIIPVSIEPLQEEKDFSIESIAYMNEIVNECANKDVKIIFVTIPYEGGYSYGNAMKQYANEHNCDYINLFEYLDVIGLDENQDFHDGAHLNQNGAKKITKFLGDYIVLNYHF